MSRSLAALALLVVHAAPARAGAGAPEPIPGLAISVSGAPLAPDQSSPVDFGPPLGRTSTVVFTLSSTGTAPLTIRGTAITGRGFVADDLEADVELPPGTHVDLTLTFTTLTAATSTGTLTVLSDDPSHPAFTVPLLGNGIVDADGDGVPADADCDDQDPSTARPTPWHLDLDGDGFGDAAEPLVACGGPPEGYVRDHTDNCPRAHNPVQNDTDLDGLGDRCDDDDDDDGALDRADNCPVLANADQADLDGDRKGDACDDDEDGDGAGSGFDCDVRDPARSYTQTWFVDADEDGHGEDGTDTELCTDSWPSPGPPGFVRWGGDNCPTVANPTQEDRDQDGVGAECDSDEPPPSFDLICLADGCEGDTCGCTSTAASSPPLPALLALLAAVLVARRRTSLRTTPRAAPPTAAQEPPHPR